MYKMILLCYDGSAEGRKALMEGAEIAVATRAEVYLLAICQSALSSSVPEGVTPELVSREQTAAHDLLNDGVQRLQSRGLAARGALVLGDPLHHIPKTATEVGADLIVVGHRTRGRLARWWTGSQEATLLDLVSCSILVAMKSNGSD